MTDLDTLIARVEAAGKQGFIFGAYAKLLREAAEALIALHHDRDVWQALAQGSHEAHKASTGEKGREMTVLDTTLIARLTDYLNLGGVWNPEGMDDAITQRLIIDSRAALIALHQQPADLSFDELRRTNTLRCETAFHSVEAWAPWEWSNAMAGECGEACNLTKKMNRIWPANQFKQNWNKPEDQRMADLETKLADEIADVVIYADLLATRIGRSLGDCVREKFNAKSDEIGSAIKLPVTSLQTSAPPAQEPHQSLSENPLTAQLLDLITLMPDTQTQEILDYIHELRAIRQKPAQEPQETQTPFAPAVILSGGHLPTCSWDAVAKRYHCTEGCEIKRLNDMIQPASAPAVHVPGEKP